MIWSYPNYNPTYHQLTKSPAPSSTLSRSPRPKALNTSKPLKPNRRPFTKRPKST